MEYTGAEIIIKLLERAGIEYISGIPGGANLPIYDALRRSPIQHILARHEQGAAFIAHGQARSTGKTAVCLATSGPGATNLITAIADAKLDSIPLIAITGQVPSTLIGTDAFQEVNTCEIAASIVKKKYFIENAEDLLRIIPEAFQLANSGRPGPVIIDVPKDQQLKNVQFHTWPKENGLSYQHSSDCDQLDPLKILKIAQLINQSKQPILYVGGGAQNCRNSHLIKRLAEKNSIPVTTTLMGIGTIENHHTLYLGMLGMHAFPHTNIALAKCDLLIALGARFDDRATGKVQTFCKDATIIHIDIDPKEINKNKKSHCSLVSDIDLALEKILPLIKKSQRIEWIEYIDKLKITNPPTYYKHFHPANLIRSIGHTVGDNVIVTTDVGQHQMWTAQVYPFKYPRSFLTSGGLGTMGFGLPAAIGAAIEHPKKIILCFSGDGSILMNIQELATLSELDLNVKLIIINNGSLGLVRQQQELFYQRNYFASQFSGTPNFKKIARGFGIPSYNIMYLESISIGKQIKDLLRTPGPLLLNINIDPSINVFPMVAPGGSNQEMIIEQHKDSLIFKDKGEVYPPRQQRVIINKF